MYKYITSKNSPLFVAIIVLSLFSSPSQSDEVFGRYWKELGSVPASSKYHLWGRSIAKIQLPSFDGKIRHCTGFAISNSKLLTAGHCFDWLEVGANFTVRFDAADAAGQSQTISRLLERVKIDKELDFAVIDFADISGMEMIPLSYISRNINMIEKIDNRLVSIHYPDGRYKALTITDCRLLDRLGSSYVVTHSCSAMGGSSGAPLIDPEGNVVAMHQRGLPAAEDGEPNTSDNRATLISPILKYAGLANVELDPRYQYAREFIRSEPCRFDGDNLYFTIVESIYHRDEQLATKLAFKRTLELRDIFPELEFYALAPGSSNRNWAIVTSSWVSKKTAETAKQIALKARSQNNERLRRDVFVAGQPSLDHATDPRLATCYY